MHGTPSCLFEVDESLLLALEAAFGPPIDSYLRGWQVWLEPVEWAGAVPRDGAGAAAAAGVDVGDGVGAGDAAGEPPVELEYRLHPPAGFEQPEGLSHHDLWDETIRQVADAAADAGGQPPAGMPVDLGEQQRDVASLWELLEVFPAFGEDVTAEQVRDWAEAALGRRALACGYIEHARLGGAFKRLGTSFDLAGALREALGV